MSHVQSVQIVGITRDEFIRLVGGDRPQNPDIVDILPWINAEAAAIILGCTPITVRNRAENGEIEWKLKGKSSRRYLTKDVIKLLRNGRYNTRCK